MTSNPPDPAASPSLIDVLAAQVGHPLRIRLRAHESLARTLAETRVEPTRPEPDAAAEPGTPGSGGTHGKYTLLDELGHGGVGLVMRGHDGELGREVAIKLLRERYSKDPWVLQRFIEEAQIGGQLQHPGIVPVYDFGMKDGRPFFSMKIVRGRTFSSMLAERANAESDRRRMLTVFEQVCQTLAYAHARGVIHRDLKPANVMVGAFGEVQVMDWGLGKVLDGSAPEAPRPASKPHSERSADQPIATVRSKDQSGTARSLAGSVMGTPAYMPPEQARGEVQSLDERADVFALGALLGEILTGAPPYVAPDVSALIEAAARGDLADCHRRLEACTADAELVALARECLSPEREARPRDAQAVVQRVGAYLAAVEERARRAELEAAEQRVRALAERRARRLTAGLAASVLAFITLGAGGWLWMDGQRRERVTRLERSVEAALSEAELKGSQGSWEAALAEAQRARDLVSGAEGLAPELAARVEQRGAATRAQAEAARAHAALEASNRALLASLEDVRQPEAEVVYSTDWRAVDAAYRGIFAAHDLAPDDGTVAAAAGALEARGVADRIAAALDEWSIVRRHAEDPEGAARLQAVARAADPDELRRSLRAAMQEDDLDRLVEIAERSETGLPAVTWNLLGRAFERLDRARSSEVLERAVLLHPDDFILRMNLARQLWQGATPRLEQAARHYSAAIALRPTSVEARHELALILESRLGEPERAEALIRASLALTPDDGHLYFHLGNALMERRRFAEAEESLTTATRLAPNDAQAWLNLGIARTRGGDDAGSEEPLGRALALSPTSRLALANLGLALARRGASAEASALAERLERALADTNDGVGWCNLGNVFATLGDTGRAEDAYRRGLALSPTEAAPHVQLGLHLLEERRTEEAAEEFQRALALAPGHVDALDGLGAAYVLLRRYPEARDTFRELVARDPTHERARSGLGHALSVLGELDAAIESLRLAIELAPRDMRARDDLGFALLRRGASEEAISVLRAALALELVYPPAHWHLGQALAREQDYAGAAEQFRLCTRYFPSEAGAYVNLGDALVGSGDDEAAIEAYRQAVELRPELASAWCDLGLALERRGEVRAAYDALVRGHELGAAQPGWDRPSARWVEELRARLEDEDR